MLSAIWLMPDIGYYARMVYIVYGCGVWRFVFSVQGVGCGVWGESGAPPAATLLKDLTEQVLPTPTPYTLCSHTPKPTPYALTH